MNRLIMHFYMLTVAAAASYVTLALAAPSAAHTLWAVYAAVVLVLAVGNLLIERRLR